MNNRFDQQRNSNRNVSGRGRQQHVTNWNDPAFDGYSDEYDSRGDREDARVFESQNGRGRNQNNDRGFSQNYDRGFQNFDRGFNRGNSEDGYGSGSAGRNNYYRGGIDREAENFQSYDLGTGTSMRDRSNRSQLFSEQNSSTYDRGHYGKGPKGYKRTDDKIKDDVCEALHDSRSVDASDIDIEVKEGTVYLKGNVDTRDAKREAERCVEDLRGVVDVRNEIQVKRQDNVSGLNRSSTDQGTNTSRRASGLS